MRGNGYDKSNSNDNDSDNNDNNNSTFICSHSLINWLLAVNLSNKPSCWLNLIQPSFFHFQLLAVHLVLTSNNCLIFL